MAELQGVEAARKGLGSSGVSFCVADDGLLLEDGLLGPVKTVLSTSLGQNFDLSLN